MSVTRASMDYEQAGELKIGQVGIANLRIRTLDVDQLIREMRERVERAPKLFGRAAVIVDFGGLTRLPDADTARALIDGLRGAGVIPVALASACRCWPSSARNTSRWRKLRRPPHVRHPNLPRPRPPPCRPRKPPTRSRAWSRKRRCARASSCMPRTAT